MNRSDNTARAGQLAHCTRRNPTNDAIHWQHVIGIVGGLGPHAHIELEKALLEATARLLNRPPQDQDYPAWRLASFPATPDRTLALLGLGPSPLPWLERSVRILTSGARGFQADFIVIACITAHAYLEELQKRVAVPVLDMVAETIRAASDLGARRLGVLATTGALQAGIYQEAAARIDPTLEITSLLSLNDGDRSGEWLQEHLVMEPVYGPQAVTGRAGGGLKSGLAPGPDGAGFREPLLEAVQLLEAAGAEIVILGCTELPMVLGQGEWKGAPLLDPLQVIATAAVKIASGAWPLPVVAALASHPR